MNEENVLNFLFLLLQLFSYTSSISGVISPTNLSLYTSTPVTGTVRTTPRTRWNSQLYLEDDFNMITHPVTNNTSEGNSVILMEDGNYYKNI